MKTFKQWQNFESRKLLESLDDPDITLQECRECRDVSQWLNDHLIPAIKSGETVRYSVCRSIVDNGISLTWLIKHHDAKVPQYVLLKTGRKAL